MDEIFCMAAIELRAIEKTFGKDVVALEKVDIEVEEGEFVSLIGPSGCGKTTLLRIVAGLEEPTAGLVSINGSSPQEACRQHKIGLAFQRPALVPSRTALKNVRLTLEITGDEDAMSPEALLEEFGLEDFVDRYPHQLSGGMQQRVNIACALVHNPEILLLDEPFGSLDELTRETMGAWLSGILEKASKTVILVTHSVDEAVTLSDRVIVLSPRPGRIEEILDIAEFSEPGSKTDEIYLSETARVRDSLYRVMKEVS